MAERVLIRSQGVAKRTVVPWASEKVWTVVGWIGVVLVVAAVADDALALLPTHFSTMEWEYGTISQIFAGLPLLFLGLAAIWVSGAASGRRWVLWAIGMVLELAALILVFLLLAFALDIPVAIRTNPGPAGEPIAKMAIKTVVLGVVFGVSYVVTGVLAFKQARGAPSGEVEK